MKSLGKYIKRGEVVILMNQAQIGIGTFGYEFLSLNGAATKLFVKLENKVNSEKVEVLHISEIVKGKNFYYEFRGYDFTADHYEYLTVYFMHKGIRRRAFFVDFDNLRIDSDSFVNWGCQIFWSDDDSYNKCNYVGIIDMNFDSEDEMLDDIKHPSVLGFDDLLYHTVTYM